MNITWLRIPTGRRQTSGYLQKWPRSWTGVYQERTPAGLEPATSGFKVRRPNHSATLPVFQSIIIQLAYDIISIIVLIYNLIKISTDVLEKSFLMPMIYTFIIKWITRFSLIAKHWTLRSRFARFEMFSLNFSSSSFVIRVNLLHP